MGRFLLIITTMLSPVLASNPEAREWKAPNGTLVRYRWSAPAAIETGKTYPLVLFLHGSGERGEDNEAQLRHGVLPIIAGAAKAGHPCFLMAPQCPADRWWSPIDRETMNLSEADKPNSLLEAVLALASDLMTKHPIDPKRFHVTGLSMGGYATWDLLGRSPQSFASAIPVCGGGDPALAARFKQVPIWSFHGEEDTTVPASASRRMIAALEKAGGKPKSTFYPGVGHDSWTQTYDDPEVIRWMFDQQRP